MPMMESAKRAGSGHETTPLLESGSRPIQPSFGTSANIPRSIASTAKTGKTARWLPTGQFHDIFRKMTWNLFAAWMLTSVLNIMFGYASTVFTGLQDIPSFGHEFGTPTGENGSYGLSASRASFMSSIGLAGKLLGTLTAPFPIEHFGHKSVLFATCLISFVGIAIQCCAHTIVVFSIGRVVIYYSVGVVEVANPMYQAEIVPASMRGTILGSMQLFNQTGQILSSCINRVFYKSMKSGGWITPTAVQAIFPAVFAIGIYFIPAAPRWLISKGRKDDAVRSLETLRPRADKEAGLCQAEVDAIQDALQDKSEKAPWTDLFIGTNLRRTSIAVCVLSLQQLTGQGFVTQYSPRFYKKVGLGDQGFNYNVATAITGWVSCLIGMVVSDIVGRRDLLIWGGVTQALFLYLVSIFGPGTHPSSIQAGGLVASVILYIFVFTGTWAPVSYALAAEIGTASLREKTMGLGIAVNVLSAFTVAFSLPYLLDSIGARIGWLFGCVAILAAIYAFVFIPETKYRSLEEIDELFEARLSAREFKNAQTVGAARRVADLENRSLQSAASNE